MKQRIKDYLKFKRISQNEFSARIGVSNAYIPSIRRSIAPDKLREIQHHYPDLNIEWLLTGVGDMLNSAPVVSSTPAPSSDNTVLVLPLAAHGGGLTNIDTYGVEGSKCETITSPIAGAELAISVTGSSMEPAYPNGSRILIKSINHEAFIAWGEVYVVDTCNGVLLKELHPGRTSAYIKCVSLNRDERYKPFEVPLSEVRKIYKVLACITLR